MFKYSVRGLKNLNFKYQRGLKYNLKLIYKTENTSNLIQFENINKGCYLIEERKPVKGIYFILKGKVKVFNTASNNNSQTLRLLSNGDIVGMSSFNALKYWSSAVVVEDVEAYFIKLKNLKDILYSNNTLSLLFLNAIAKRLRHYEIRQKHLSLLPASVRVIDALLLTAYKFGNATSEGLEISTCTSRKDLSALASTSTEIVIRTLSFLKSKKHISIKGRYILINNTDELISQLKQYSTSGNLIGESYTCYPKYF